MMLNTNYMDDKQQIRQPNNTRSKICRNDQPFNKFSLLQVKFIIIII